MTSPPALSSARGPGAEALLREAPLTTPVTGRKTKREFPVGRCPREAGSNGGESDATGG